MHKEDISYEGFKGFIAYDDNTMDKRPAVLIAHAWRGLDDFAKTQAIRLAEMGYTAFAADLYGAGKVADNNTEAAALMGPLFLDRVELQKRVNLAFNILAEHKTTDRNRMGAMGFCFGGLTVLELLRSGADVKGVVTFHAVLADKYSLIKAKRAPAQPMKGSILILHGADDPLVSKEDLTALQQELNDAKVDWQLHMYSQTSHAFTYPLANDTKIGLIYNPLSAKRAFTAMKNFFNEKL